MITRKSLRLHQLGQGLPRSSQRLPKRKGKKEKSVKRDFSLPSLGLFLKALRDRLPTAKRQRKRAREEEEERGPHPWLLFGGKHIVLLSLALLPFPSRSSSRRSTFLRELLRVRDGGGGGGGGGGDCCLTHNALSSLLHRCLLAPSSVAQTLAK